MRPQVVLDGTRWTRQNGSRCLRILPDGPMRLQVAPGHTRRSPGGAANVIPDGIEQFQVVLKVSRWHQKVIGGIRWSSSGAAKEVQDDLE